MPEQDIQSRYTDDLSPFARQVLGINLSEAYRQLVVHGPGNGEAKQRLEGAGPEMMLSAPVRDKEHARGMLAGLWLWHDWLDASHVISQELHSETGSFWHAIMHRREGDFWNSKHWYRKCEGHLIFATLGQNANAILNPLPADKAYLRLTASGWDAGAFVDLVEAVEGNKEDARRATAVSLQQLEWRLLFDYCTRKAAGK